MPKVFAQYLDKSKYMSTPVGLSVEKNPRLGILVASPPQATVAMKQSRGISVVPWSTGRRSTLKKTNQLSPLHQTS